MVLFVLLMPLLTFQEADPKYTYQDAFRVDFVRLDVRVVDRKGRPVTDLTQADFAIEEDGEAVAITFFDTLDYRAESTSTTTNGPSAGAGSAQQITLAFDFESVTEEQRLEVLNQVEAFLGEQPDSMPFRLRMYCLELGFLGRDFTDSRGTARFILDNFRNRYREYRSQTPTAAEELLEEDVPESDNSGDEFGDDDDFWTDKPVKRVASQKARRAPSRVLNRLGEFEDILERCTNVWCVRDAYNAFMDQQALRTGRMISKLEQLAYQFEPLSGPKSLVFLSPGFSLKEMSAAADLAMFYTNPVQFPSQKRTNHAAQLIGKLNYPNDFKSVVHACTRNRVILHSLDIYNRKLDQGFRARPKFRKVDPEVRIGSQGPEFRKPVSSTLGGYYTNYSREITSGLKSLAKESGGSFHQKARLAPVMTEVLAGNQFYFVLGYTASPSGSGSFRNIKIKVKRRGVNLSYRKGYFPRR